MHLCFFPQRASSYQDGHLIFVSDPIQLIGGFFSTGEGERKTSYEPVENVLELKDGELVQDPESDAMALIINVKNSGSSS
jgi:hypothetical protein